FSVQDVNSRIGVRISKNLIEDSRESMKSTVKFRHQCAAVSVVGELTARARSHFLLKIAHDDQLTGTYGRVAWRVVRRERTFSAGSSGTVGTEVPLARGSG